MKITKSQLKKIILEELNEAGGFGGEGESKVETPTNEDFEYLEDVIGLLSQNYKEGESVGISDFLEQLQPEHLATIYESFLNRLDKYLREQGREFFSVDERHHEITFTTP